MRVPTLSDSAVRDLDLLARRPEPDLDAMVELTASICATPIAVVSVLDGDEHSAKAGVGVDLGAPVRGQPLCAHTIDGHGLLVVPDARADPRFADHPDVRREPGIRFYAGAPLLTSEGYALGALCVVDAVPRRLSLGQLQALRALSRQITSQLELRRLVAGLFRSRAREQEVERLRNELSNLVRYQLVVPLSELRACVELLRDTPDCPPEIAHRLGVAAHAGATDLLRLLDDLVRIVGPPKNEPELHPRTVDLAAITEEAVRSVRPIGDAKDIPLRIDRPPGPVPVFADPARLGQALSHLLFNAVKFTPCGGQLRVEVDPSPSIRLRDLGPCDERPCLYEHLYEAAMMRPLGSPGPDIGLSVVKAILDASHATIAMSDEAGSGTAVHILFPGVELHSDP